MFLSKHKEVIRSQSQGSRESRASQNCMEVSLKLSLWGIMVSSLSLCPLTDTLPEEIPRMDRLHGFLYWHHGPANSRSDHQENPEEFHLPAGSLQVLPVSHLNSWMMRQHWLCWCWVCGPGQKHSESSCFNVSCRNKVIWVGIASQIIIALILSCGLGSITALNFTMLRWVPSAVGRKRPVLLWAVTA